MGAGVIGDIHSEQGHGHSSSDPVDDWLDETFGGGSVRQLNVSSMGLVHCKSEKMHGKIKRIIKRKCQKKPTSTAQCRCRDIGPRFERCQPVVDAGDAQVHRGQVVGSPASGLEPSWNKKIIILKSYCKKNSLECHNCSRTSNSRRAVHQNTFVRVQKVEKPQWSKMVDWNSAIGPFSPVEVSHNLPVLRVFGAHSKSCFEQVAFHV